MAEYIEKWSVVNRLIDLENELRRHKPFHGFKHAMYRKICEAEIAIGKMPAADVAPVRNGRWLYHTPIDGHIHAECSECHKIRIIDNFCPNCGAKMDKEEG